MGSSPARLVIALSVAAALAIFVVYTALAGNGVANLTPSTVAGHTGDVSLVGKVVGRPQGNAYHGGGLRFRLKDIGHGTPARVPVVYRGSRARPVQDRGAISSSRERCGTGSSSRSGAR